MRTLIPAAPRRAGLTALLLPLVALLLHSHRSAAQQLPPPEGPFVFRGGVVNSASFTPNLMPSGGVARGSIFSIFGRGLGPPALVQVSRFPLANQLAGVSINLRQGTQRLAAAIPLIVVESQINAILPSATPVGAVSLQVVVNGRESNWVSVQVVEHAPSVFTATGIGFGWGSIFNFESATSQPLNTGRAAAKPGQIVTLWATGTGPVSVPDNEAPPIGNLPFNFEIFVGGKAVSTKLYTGRAPGIAGLDQVVFNLPDDAPTGCFVPVYLRVNGAVSNATTIAIMPQGGACGDAHNPIGPALFRGGKIVHALVSRGTATVQVSGQALDVAADTASLRAMEERENAIAFDPFLTAPPPGACTGYSMKGDAAASGFRFSGAGRPLALGTLSIRSGSGERRLDALQPGIFRSPDSAAQLTFLDASAVASVRATGGADGRAFDVPISTAGGGAALAGLTTPSTLTRSAGATINWTAQPGVSAAVVGVVFDRPTNNSAIFHCVSAPGAPILSIPAYVLAHLPPTREERPGATSAQLFVTAVPQLRETSTEDGLRIFGARQDVTVRAIQQVR